MIFHSKITLTQLYFFTNITVDSYLRDSKQFNSSDSGQRCLLVQHVNAFFIGNKQKCVSGATVEPTLYRTSDHTRLFIVKHHQKCFTKFKEVLWRFRKKSPKRVLTNLSNCENLLNRADLAGAVQTIFYFVYFF